MSESLFFDVSCEGFGNLLVEVAGVADVGENLSQCLLLVYFYEITIFGKGFLRTEDTVDVLRGVVLVALVIDYALDGLSAPGSRPRDSRRRGILRALRARGRRAPRLWPRRSM